MDDDAIGAWARGGVELQDGRFHMRIPEHGADFLRFRSGKLRPLLWETVGDKARASVELKVGETSLA